VIPHDRLGAACTSCHNPRGVEVAGLGFAPPSPHEWTDGLSATSRCEQCHVFQITAEVFAINEFSGLRQDLRRGGRLHPGAPPVMPHPAFMRENCRACHTGPAARAEIVCDHPERLRCPQCHVEEVTAGVFAR
jgi:cytochrome c-type protein NapB